MAQAEEPGPGLKMAAPRLGAGDSRKKKNKGAREPSLRKPAEGTTETERNARQREAATIGDDEREGAGRKRIEGVASTRNEWWRVEATRRESDTRAQRQATGVGDDQR